MLLNCGIQSQRIKFLTNNDNVCYYHNAGGCRERIKEKTKTNQRQEDLKQR